MPVVVGNLGGWDNGPSGTMGLLGGAWVGAWVVHGCMVVVVWWGVVNDLLYYLDWGWLGGGGLVGLDLIIGESWFDDCGGEVIYGLPLHETENIPPRPASS